MRVPLPIKFLLVSFVAFWIFKWSMEYTDKERMRSYIEYGRYTASVEDRELKEKQEKEIVEHYVPAKTVILTMYTCCLFISLLFVVWYWWSWITQGNSYCLEIAWKSTGILFILGFGFKILTDMWIMGGSTELKVCTPTDDLVYGFVFTLMILVVLWLLYMVEKNNGKWWSWDD